MSRSKKYNTKAIYFTDRLKERMSELTEYPCTVLEAPMGYGKTTAVKGALSDLDPIVLWHNVYEEGISDFWIGFCDEISKIDMDFANNLLRMGFPTDAVLKHEMMRLMQNMNTSDHTIFVIDDYHLVKNAEVDKFLLFFIRNLPSLLHIVIITRISFLSDIPELQIKGFINHIGIGTLEFTPSDIVKYYRLCGITISEQEQKMLYSNSEGWISALYLFMLEYTVHGKFTPSKDITSMVRQTIYLPLNDELKVFLNCICIFDSFNLKQAQHMCRTNNAEELLVQLLYRNAFITVDNFTGDYHLHNIFTICIREEFEKQTEEKQKELWLKAGYWYLENEEYVYATDFFYKAKAYDEMLLSIEKNKVDNFDNIYKDKVIHYIKECPKEIRLKHPLTMLVYARRAYMLNEREIYRETCSELLENLYSEENRSENYNNSLLGEYELLVSFAEYNDIEKMSEHHQRACELMTSPSLVMDYRTNWTFGSFSILNLFYRESGRLLHELDIIKKSMVYYYQITDGHGTGAEYVMESENYFMSGEFQNAEISVYKALSNAKSKSQWSIILCAEFLQVRLAINKGDYAGVNYRLHHMREILNNQKQFTLLHTLDTCEAYVYALLGCPQKSADWILRGDFANTKMLFPAMPTFHIVFGRIILEQKEYIKLIGMSEIFLKIASIFPNLLSQIFIHIYLAAAYNYLFKREEALFHLEQALNIAIPDNIYMPFVENGEHIDSMLYKFALKTEYNEMLKKYSMLYEDYSISIKSIKKVYFAATSESLTEREKEVARLAANGLSNKEIGELLFISENTVKSRLKSIFEKLSIKSRAQLDEHINK